MGSLLMLMVLVALAGVVAINFYNIAGDGASTHPLMAKISLESCEGGLFNDGPQNKRATLENNTIVLLHEGGSSLPVDAISIKISGYGNSYHGIADGNGTKIVGNAEIFYENLSLTGKNPTYYLVNNKATLEDGSWNVGERLVLCGKDSAVGATKSSVKVSVDGDSDTSDNYGFKVGSEIIIKVVDTKSSNVIAEQRAIVKHYEG
ncbi:type IV pilin [Methanosarcina sp. UBA5]|uniref:type IV pilin n=1 Tax=Methanosarcina sp. UBA5 TaxID=1915593 RepID=UPI0025ECAB70|nr:type IV pilin [Methanosarcina sp. UBA5]